MSRGLMMTWRTAAPLALAFSFAGAQAASPGNDDVLRPFLAKHCVECHDADTKKGGLDLEKLALRFDEPASFDEWVKVHDKLHDGEMPPKKKERPPAKDSEAVLRWLNKQL